MLVGNYVGIGLNRNNICPKLPSKLEIKGAYNTPRMHLGTQGKIESVSRRQTGTHRPTAVSRELPYNQPAYSLH